MRILMLTQFFQPEPNFKGLPFAHELQRRGHKVEVLTGLPNYPGGKLYPGYRIRPWQREVIEGIRVNRVPLYPSHDKSAVRRIANYGSFALSASLLGPLLAKRPDVIHVYHPPATVGLPAMVLKALRGCPVVYDIHDLWPDTVAASGMMSKGLLFSMLDRWCRFAYKRMDRIVVVSPGFRDKLIERGVPAEKIDVIYNWADEAALSASGENDDLARRLGVDGCFNIVFAGTMGLAQRLDTALDAARLCAASMPDVRFIFVGGGIDKTRLESRAAEMGLPNVLFLPCQPMSAVGAYLSMADALLVHLKDDPLFRITIPSKTQAYLTFGKPILMAVEGDSADLVNRSGGGVTCPPENAEALVAAVKRLHETGPSGRKAMGERGKIFYEKHLSMNVGAEKYERLFQVAARRADASSTAIKELRRAA